MVKSYTCLNEIKSDLANKEITVEKLVKNYLDKIASNSHLNAFNEVFDKEALIYAKKVDVRIKQGVAGKLAGMVIAIKDNICYKGRRCCDYWPV